MVRHLYYNETHILTLPNNHISNITLISFGSIRFSQHVPEKQLRGKEKPKEKSFPLIYDKREKKKVFSLGF